MENDRLSQYLVALEREGSYRVDAILKESPHEVTQRVFFVDESGAEQGPFIRKFIDRDSGMGTAYERIFEAQGAGRRFEHIPRIHECYQDEKSLVVVMDFVHGETLQDVVYHRDPSLQLARELFPAICDAVTELHEAFEPPLIHRDLKPSNIMLSDGTFAIIDFGIARAFRQGADADTVKFGTRAFAPPEQFGYGQTTVRSDVYALGMLLYYCLTEQIPTPQVRAAGFECEGVPARLRPVVMRATAVDASQRYASAAELKAAFLEAVRQEPIAAHAHEGAPRRRSRAIALACALAVILAIAATLAFFAGAFDQQGQQDEQASSIAAQGESPADDTASTASERVGDSSRAQTSDTSDAAGETAESQRAAAPGGQQADAPGGQQADAPEDHSEAGADAAAIADAASENMQSTAPPRNDFNPETNTSATVAGVDFQIPRCFGTPSATDEDVAYYYAERGTSCAMIMTGQTAMSAPAGEHASPEGITRLKDDFLAGLITSNEALFSEVIQQVDFSLAGHPARIVTFRGTIEGLPMTSTIAYFYNQDMNTIGSMSFGQTDNTQFDYSQDFAKTLASAVA